MEKERYQGTVIRQLLDTYRVQVESPEKMVIEAKVRGSIKKKHTILVGDRVEIEKNYDIYMIENIQQRRNALIRPPVANIDTLVIVLSVASPSPDYMLLDKQIILCKQKQIRPVICINKTDLVTATSGLEREIAYIKQVYGPLCDTILLTSAANQEGIQELKETLKNSISAFSGNSGVGKSSILSTLLLELAPEAIEIGEISSKTQKGKHTTKYVQLYEIGKNSYLLDTPGFSSYELYAISCKELKQYYEEFEACNCVYEDCSHILEGIDVCMVKKQVEQGKIDQGRYERYVYLYQTLKDKEDKKYK